MPAIDRRTAAASSGYHRGCVRGTPVFGTCFRVDLREQNGAPSVQMTLKEFRHLAQSTQSIVLSAAVVAALALAWQALKIYRDAQYAPTESVSQD
jgi:hypothetical protein